MNRPKALDLFCSAGGASMGLYRAGFDVTGVDWVNQPRYPFKFRMANALYYPLEGFDFIWASPPCQAYTRSCWPQKRNGKQYPDLLPPMADKLRSCGVAYAIENVPGAPLRVDLVLCGSLFDLPIVRHRWFEIGFRSFNLVQSCAHVEKPICVVGHGTTSWTRKKNGGKCHSIQDMRRAMDIDWMNRGELSQSVPPAYSEFIGKQAIEYLRRKADAA
jgi:DNA (cytosine-5)-methyltransferase 1